MSVVVYRIGLALASSVADQAYGSILAAGRWHTLNDAVRAGAGQRRVIYAASSRALVSSKNACMPTAWRPWGRRCSG